jgi:hypothetical protein
MVILKATSFLEGHKRDMGMTFRITRIPYNFKEIVNFQITQYDAFINTVRKNFPPKGLHFHIDKDVSFHKIKV